MYLILPAALGPGGFTQPVTEMSTGNKEIIIFRGSKARPVRKADNLAAAATCEPIVCKVCYGDSFTFLQCLSNKRKENSTLAISIGL
jgi:hypothetical protein